MAKDPKAERHFRITNNNAIDLHVGQRLRLRRTLLGMSQEQLGADLNITFQQVRNTNVRRSDQRFASLGHEPILDVSVSYFFDDMSETTMQSSPRRVARGLDHGDEADDGIKDPMARRETLELVRTCYTIGDASPQAGRRDGQGRRRDPAGQVTATCARPTRRRDAAGPRETGT